VEDSEKARAFNENMITFSTSALFAALQHIMAKSPISWAYVCCNAVKS
jgi:hypothetical protein